MYKLIINIIILFREIKRECNGKKINFKNILPFFFVFAARFLSQFYLENTKIIAFRMINNRFITNIFDYSNKY